MAFVSMISNYRFLARACVLGRCARFVQPRPEHRLRSTANEDVTEGRFATFVNTGKQQWALNLFEQGRAAGKKVEQIVAEIAQKRCITERAAWALLARARKSAKAELERFDRLFE